MESYGLLTPASPPLGRRGGKYEAEAKCGDESNGAFLRRLLRLPIYLGPLASRRRVGFEVNLAGETPAVPGTGFLHVQPSFLHVQSRCLPVKFPILPVQLRFLRVQLKCLHVKK